MDWEYSINLDSIYSQLVKDAGRFCATNASDVVYVVNELNNMVAYDYLDGIALIGIHPGGIDTTNCILGALFGGHWNPRYYKCIYGVKIWHKDNKVFAELRDVEHTINSPQEQFKLTLFSYLERLSRQQPKDADDLEISETADVTEDQVNRVIDAFRGLNSKPEEVSAMETAFFE